MNHLLRTLTLAAAAFLGACASIRVPAPEPAAVPAAWAHDNSLAPSPRVAGPVQTWWTTLGDGQLDRLIARALAANSDVRVLAARLRRAQASADLSEASERPELSASGISARERVPAASTPDGQGGSATTPAYKPSRFGVLVEGRYEVDLLGRLALNKDAALAEREASADDLRAMRQWLAFEVVQTYAELRLADDRIAISQAASALIEQLLEAERRRLAAGLINRNDLRATERQRAEKLDEQAELQRQRSFAVIRLAGLLGEAPIALTLPPRTMWFASIELTGAVAPDLPASVIERRADVAAAWQRVTAAHRTAQSMRLERYPALTLTGSTGFASTALRRWLRGDALVWVVQAALQAPLLDGGRERAKNEQAMATLEERQAEHRKSVLQALGEVETALNATAVARQRVDLAQEEGQRRAADRNSAQTALSAGVGSRPNLLQAEVAEVTVSELMQVRRHELLLAWANAQKALGQ